MRKFVFNKLVRNDVLDSMLAEGANPVHRELSHSEYIAGLKDKILEEAAELKLDDPDQLAKELADVQEVIDCLVAAIGKTSADILAAQAQKTARYGTFDKKIYVDTVDVRDDSVWLPHYLENPDRYPEIHNSNRNPTQT